MLINRWYRYSNGYKIAFNYDAEIVEKLKATIPHTYRTWDDDKKEWWISDDYLPELDRLFTGFTTMVKSQLSLF